MWSRNELSSSAEVPLYLCRTVQVRKTCALVKLRVAQSTAILSPHRLTTDCNFLVTYDTMPYFKILFTDRDFYPKSLPFWAVSSLDFYSRNVGKIYQSRLRNNPEDRRSHQHNSGRLNTRRIMYLLFTSTKCLCTPKSAFEQVTAAQLKFHSASWFQ
jgi:hypothetical protein